MKVRQNKTASVFFFLQILNCHLLSTDGRPSEALFVCEISPANMYMCVRHGHPATVISLSLITVSPRHVLTSHPSTFPVHHNAVLWPGRYRIASLVAFLALSPHGNGIIARLSVRGADRIGYCDHCRSKALSTPLPVCPPSIVREGGAPVISGIEASSLPLLHR